MKRFLILLSFFAFFVPTTHAQVDLVTDKDISVNLSPAIPRPSEQVTATLVSYSADLNNAIISWTINGKLAISDRGKKSYSFTMGAVGVNTTLDIAIVLSPDLRIDKKVVLTPADVDILYEAPDTYVPPFYRGKALPASEALIKVVAIPNRTNMDPKIETYTYDWKRAYNAVPASSGYAKNYFVFKNSYLNKDEKVSVLVTNSSGFTGEQSLTIPFVKPKILFYQKSPILGIQYDSALQSGFRLGGSDMTIVAEPYYFAPKNAASDSLTYTWKVGGVELPVPPVKNMLLVTAPKGESGTSRISLSIESIPRLFQEATADLLVNIGK